MTAKEKGTTSKPHSQHGQKSERHYDPATQTVKTYNYEHAAKTLNDARVYDEDSSHASASQAPTTEAKHYYTENMKSFSVTSNNSDIIARGGKYTPTASTTKKASTFETHNRGGGAITNNGSSVSDKWVQTQQEQNLQLLLKIAEMEEGIATIQGKSKAQQSRKARTVMSPHAQTNSRSGDGGYEGGLQVLPSFVLKLSTPPVTVELPEGYLKTRNDRQCIPQTQAKMKLYQTKWGISAMTNNTYYNDQGHVVYKVDTPFKSSNRTSTITKILPSAASSITVDVPVSKLTAEEEEDGDNLMEVQPGDDDASSIDLEKKADWEEDTETLVDEAGSSGLVNLSSGFEYLAQIDWRFFASSKFRFGNGGEITAKEFFKKEGWGPYGRHRVFIAKDGREYRWNLGLVRSELFLKDSAKTPVAKFHRKSSRVVGKSRPAYLEIFPAGEHMVDEIFVTFIYIEKLRKEKERAARPKGGGGP
ncbi:hypothetical protein Moror_2091 [Moniliophthora roreri MCA 2997]|uniref:DUF6593 domain-containing protein n=2 Tax=Moniliophthora roreri TaxID=221103 RepID=V2WU80_MONRO|nr:hypothetical protein Moror_2091 [Moniliophthora roreri MCA 2997]